MREDEPRGIKFGDLNNYSDPNMSSTFDHKDTSPRSSYDQSRLSSGEGSPMMMSPWNQPSPSWSDQNNEKEEEEEDNYIIQPNRLIGSLVREEGHIYSLAASGDLLFTGSASKNIRVWKNLREFSGFRSNSGLVKAIIISGEKIFTGHQDGKIRVWKVKSPNSPDVYKRIGTLPTLMDVFKSSVKPSNYVEVRRRRMGLWIKHTDAVSSLSISEDRTFLYSASWDRTMKIWRLDDSKCVESVKAHDDAVNAVVSVTGGLVFTGAADGTVKVWRRELHGKIVKHVLAQKLLQQESAVTSLAVNPTGSIVYCGSSDGLVNFWEREKEQYFTHGGVLRGHRLAVLCLAAAGERVVLSGSADRTVCVWRREGLGHVCLSVLTGHTGPVKCLAVERDGDSVHPDQRWVVYSGSLDKSVKVWSVSEFAAVLNRTGVTQRCSDGRSLGMNRRW